MLPKKKAKTGLIGPPLDKPVKAHKGSKSGKGKSKKSPKPVPSTSSSMETRSHSCSTGSTFIEAAQGAGIYSTEQLKAIRRANATAPVGDDAVDLAPNEADLNELAPVPEQSDQESPGEGGSGQSSSESEEEMEVEEGELQADTSSPLRRKITYDRKNKQFTATELSPSSLEGGRDTRDLAKLQEILDSNPPWSD